MRNFLKIIIGLMLIMTVGCTRKVYVPVETVRIERDTLAVMRSKVDTILERDTVRIEQRGDTVLISQVKWREKIRLRSDTVYKSRIDSVSIPVPIEVEKRVEVPRPPSLWQKVTGTLGSIAIVLTLILTLLHLLRKKLRS